MQKKTILYAVYQIGTNNMKELYAATDKEECKAFKRANRKSGTKLAIGVKDTVST